MVTQIVYRGQIRTLECIKKDKIIKKDKMFYFDDLVMSNIISFIPKYVKRYTKFRVGVFEEQWYHGTRGGRVLKSPLYHKYNFTPNIYIIKKITPKMVYIMRVRIGEIGRNGGGNRFNRRKVMSSSFRTKVVETKNTETVSGVRAVDLVPITDENYGKLNGRPELNELRMVGMRDR